jgi:hypothetical protein
MTGVEITLNNDKLYWHRKFILLLWRRERETAFDVAITHHLEKKEHSNTKTSKSRKPCPDAYDLSANCGHVFFVGSFCNVVRNTVITWADIDISFVTCISKIFSPNAGPSIYYEGEKTIID